MRISSKSDIGYPEILLRSRHSPTAQKLARDGCRSPSWPFRPIGAEGPANRGAAWSPRRLPTGVFRRPPISPSKRFANALACASTAKFTDTTTVYRYAEGSHRCFSSQWRILTIAVEKSFPDRRITTVCMQSPAEICCRDPCDPAQFKGVSRPLPVPRKAQETPAAVRRLRTKGAQRIGLAASSPQQRAGAGWGSAGRGLRCPRRARRNEAGPGTLSR